MFTTLEQFCDVWKDESGLTYKVLCALTDESLAQAVTKDHRTLGRIGWHLTQSIPEMVRRTGLKVAGPDPEQPVPTSAKVIADNYSRAAASLHRELRARWTDDTLAIEDDQFGEKWKRAFTLRALVLHQAHHRGQMTVLMRQAGLRPPDIYGPAKESWAQWNMQPPAI
jgi:uncharacterized damage-inducible protein DinB